MAILAVAAYVILFLPVAWFLLFASGFFWSTRSTVVAIVALMSPMALLAFILYRRFRLLAVVAIVVGLLGPAFLTLGALDSTAPPPDYLAERLDEVGVPSDWIVLEERRHDGNPICFDVCPGVCRIYRSSGPATLATVDLLFERFATSPTVRVLVFPLASVAADPYNCPVSRRLVMTVKTDRVETRLSPEQRSAIEQAADFAGESMSSFIVSAAVERAEELIAAHTSTIVPSKYFDQLLAALDEPAESSPRLAAAAKRARRQRRITHR